MRLKVKGYGWGDEEDHNNSKKKKKKPLEESKAHLTLVSDLGPNKGSKNQVACPRPHISTSDGCFMTPDNEKNPTNWFQKQKL